MRRISRCLALAATFALAAQLRSAIPFPQAGSDLRPDPAISFGTLPNGVRYVVMANHEPKNRASLRLLVLAGSFEETEEQRGLAHFLEHMAFNGSTHFAPGTLVERLQRLGMGFGADTNAATSFDHTVYQLEMPDTAPATLTEGLQILADYGGGLLIKPAMINKERGIILSEKRTRDSVAYRSFVSKLGFVFSGTLVPERLPIGLTPVIEKSGRDPFVDFYDTWYRPENFVVIVVGDIDGPSMERQIAGMFSPIGPRAPEHAPIDLGNVADFSGVHALFHGEPEAPDTQVAIESVVPRPQPPNTAANEIRDVLRTLSVEMLNRRLSILARKEGAPFTRAEAGVEEAFRLYRESSIEVHCKADQWGAALGVAEQELRRALQFGFRPDELKEEVADYRNELEEAVKTASTRRSEELASEIAESLVDREVFTSPADDLALLGPVLDRVSPADCADALRDAWAAPGRCVVVSGNASIAGDANAAVAAAYAASTAVAVKPTDAEASKLWAYANFGPKGAVAARAHVDDLDFTEITFENGVRLNLKKTSFEANTIHVHCRLGTGELTQPEAEPGLGTFANLTYSAGGLGRHSIDDLQEILAGKTVGCAFESTQDAFVLEGDTDKDNLALEFQLLTASITDPGYRPESLRVARKRIEAAYQGFEHTERGPLNVEVPRLLAGGDTRFGLPQKDAMMALNLDELRAWLAPQLSAGAIEVTVVGDFDADAVIDAAARTVGTLPRRAPRPPLEELRRVSFPSRPFARDFPVDTRIPKSVVEFYWPTADAMDVHRGRRLTLLAEVLSDRLRVRLREQLGSTYAPQAQSSASDIFPGYGFMSASALVDPAKAGEVADAVAAVAKDLQ
ncbi:MAG TPA: insulinase family protein, partial [Opitutaceae bacterium]|nr:insulinase family protein [Opitutaceae bacterium]